MPAPRPPTLLALSLLVGLSLAPGPARAGEAYYLIMFGAQRIPNNPDYSHTFATFVKTCWAGDGPMQGPVHYKAYTISWLPTNGVVRTLALFPECGRNWGLHETVQWALSNGERVSLWGPYPIHPDLYRRALGRIRHLDSGQVRYKAVDSGRDVGRVSNCIHAVSEVAGGFRLRVASPGFGEVASYAVLLRFRRWLLSECPQFWVSSALGLDRYPIIYRGGVNPPRSGALFGPIYRALGGERDLMATYGPPR